jgi:hypothetical protein
MLIILSIPNRKIWELMLFDRVKVFKKKYEISLLDDP